MAIDNHATLVVINECEGVLPLLLQGVIVGRRNSYSLSRSMLYLIANRRSCERRGSFIVQKKVPKLSTLRLHTEPRE